MSTPASKGDDVHIQKQSTPPPPQQRSIPTVSVVVVSADSGQMLRECARRILASTVPMELIVVDNGSDDGQPEALQRAFQNDDRLRMIYNRANLGFGPAANRGAAEARGRFIAIVNPDCLLEPGDLGHMIDIASNDADAGVVGAVVCDAEGKPDPASRRHDPLMMRTLNTLLGRRDAGVNVAGPMPEQPVAVEAISGALMVFPRAVYNRVSGFDEKYFLHFEDLDICRRLRDAGYRVILAGNLHVLHGKGGSSKHRPVFVSKHKHRGMWRWFRQHDRAARSPVLSAVVWLAIWTHFGLTAPKLWLRRRRA
jgi:N-acetylglucosaminyl-diphospho-decaprenol L-rhamnosyltransferase